MATDDGDAPKPKRSRGKAVVIAMPERRELRPAHLEDLRSSGLTDETIALAQLYSESRTVVLSSMLERGYSRHWGHAIVFPLYLPGEVEPYAFRIKPDRPRIRRQRNGKDKPVKYDQAESHGVLVYYPPRGRAGDWLRDTTRTLYWVEGEKKALALDQLGLACVGLTGVWNWGDPDAEGDRLHGRILSHVNVAGRACVICYDADALQNDSVMLAAGRLAGVLRALGAVSVLFVCPPLGSDAPGAPPLLKGIDDYYGVHGEAATRALLATAAYIEPVDPKQPLQRLRRIRALKSAPLDERLVLPESYDIERDGSLWVAGRSARQGDCRIAHRAMYITRKLVDVYSGELRYELAYAEDGDGGDAWHTRTVSGRAATDARTLLAELGPFGAPVTNNSAGKVVDWFEAYVHANTRALGAVTSVSTSGWHALNGERVFVTHRPIGKEGSSMELAIDTRGDRRKLLEALTPRGELDAHVAALRRAFDADPVCAAMICAALAAPLLGPFSSPNFAMHLPGESSRGKTSMLKIAASIYGNPTSAHWVANWNVTAVGAEIRASMLCDLPQCYDEIGGGDQDVIQRLVYALVNGGGRTRAQRDLALRETQSWRTIVLSTGERELGGETAATGVQVRVVQLRVSGFGKLTGTEIDALREECERHSGRVGEAWIETLVEEVNDPDAMAKHQTQLRTALVGLRIDAKNQLQGRVATYFGLLMLAEAFAAKRFGIGKPDGGTMLELYTSLASRDPIADVASRGLELARNWVLSDPEAFPELEVASSGDLDAPRSSRVSKARSGFRRADGAVLFIPDGFRRFFRSRDLSHLEVLHGWKDQGLLSHDAKRLDKNVRLGSQTDRFYVLTRSPIDASDAEGSP